MEYRDQISALLQQWLSRTSEESRAIQAGDWPALRKIQQAKAQLRSTLASVIEQWRAQRPAEADLTLFRQDAARLRALESYNGDLLATRRRKVEEKKARLEQARFNLRRLRSSYAPRPASALTSYS